LSQTSEDKLKLHLTLADVKKLAPFKTYSL